jgi:polyhydroxybutyrate depolymerase
MAGRVRRHEAVRGLPACLAAVAMTMAIAVTTVGIAPLTTASAASAPPTGAPCQQAPTPGDSRISLISGGIERTAVLHVPPAPAGQRMAVLIGLHGAGGGFFEGYSGFSVLADAEGFIAVYPNATDEGGRGAWNINDQLPGAPDDVQFISDLLDQLESTLCVDSSRIYAAGVSNGGGMAARLACQLSGRIAAIASVAGGYGSLPPCHPLNPVSVLEVHGTFDGVVPYWGGVDGTGAVRPWLAAWAARDGCRAAPRVSLAAARVKRFTWTRCAEGSAVEHLEIEGGGHQLPGALPPDRGQASTISTPWLAWSFLREHRLAPPYTVGTGTATSKRP